MAVRGEVPTYIGPVDRDPDRSTERGGSQWIFRAFRGWIDAYEGSDAEDERTGRRSVRWAWGGVEIEAMCTRCIEGPDHGALVHRCNADTCVPTIPVLLPLSFFLLTSGLPRLPCSCMESPKFFTVLVNFKNESVSCAAV